MTPAKQILTELPYLPPVSFFCEVACADTLLLEACENFQKQTWRNRSYILTAQGTQQLTVPVLHTGINIPIKEVKIDISQPWARNHWRSVQTSYGKSPYFEFLYDRFEKVYLTKWKYLFDLNLELLTICLNTCGVKIKVKQTEVYEKTPRGYHLSDKRNIPIHHWENQTAAITPYRQVFGNDFVSGLSIIDLLFNTGRESGSLLRNGSKSGLG